MCLGCIYIALPTAAIVMKRARDMRDTCLAPHGWFCEAYDYYSVFAINVNGPVRLSLELRAELLSWSSARAS